LALWPVNYGGKKLYKIVNTRGRKKMKRKDWIKKNLLNPPKISRLSHFVQIWAKAGTPSWDSWAVFAANPIR
jgi:hypothetical protein